MNQKTICAAEASADKALAREIRERQYAKREASTARYVARLKVRDARQAEHARRQERRFAGGRHADLG